MDETSGISRTVNSGATWNDADGMTDDGRFLIEQKSSQKMDGRIASRDISLLCQRAVRFSRVPVFVFHSLPLCSHFAIIPEPAWWNIEDHEDTGIPIYEFRFRGESLSVPWQKIDDILDERDNDEVVFRLVTKWNRHWILMTLTRWLRIIKENP